MSSQRYFHQLSGQQQCSLASQLLSSSSASSPSSSSSCAGHQMFSKSAARCSSCLDFALLLGSSLFLLAGTTTRFAPFAEKRLTTTSLATVEFAGDMFLPALVSSTLSSSAAWLTHWLARR